MNRGFVQPSKQEYLRAAFNACMMVGYVTLATLHDVEIGGEGKIDLLGFLELNSNIRPGYDEIYYTVRIRGAGMPEQFQNIHETVMATSPNRSDIANPIRLTLNLVVN